VPTLASDETNAEARTKFTDCPPLAPQRAAGEARADASSIAEPAAFSA
jgi:hypothetical protein